MKKTLTQKQIAEYEQLCYDRDHGRLLTPDGLRFICAAYDYNAEAIGKHFLELLPKLCPTGEAYRHLMAEVEKGWNSAEEQGWIDIDETETLLGIKSVCSSESSLGRVNKG